MRTFFTRLTTFLLVAATFACHNETTAPPPPPVTGGWRLQTVNGTPLPFPLAVTTTISGGTVTLNASGSFTQLFTYTVIDQGQSHDETDTLTGTYTQSGTTLTLTIAPQDVETGTVAGDTITLTRLAIPNWIYVYTHS